MDEDVSERASVPGVSRCLGAEEIFDLEVGDVLGLDRMGLDVGVDLVLVVLAALGVGGLGLLLELDVVGDGVVDGVVCGLMFLVFTSDDNWLGEEHHRHTDEGNQEAGDTEGLLGFVRSENSYLAGLELSAFEGHADHSGDD